MYINQHTNAPSARQARAVDRVIKYRQNAAERIAAAQSRRDRKNAKRAACQARQT